MTDDPNKQSGDKDSFGTELRTGSDANPVGYRNPPAEHRFRKGQSGNPNGRPRKKKLQVALREGTHGPSERPGNQLLLAEAYRPVVLREGDKVIEMPAIQAVFRAMNVAAMKGNRLTQKMVAEMVANVEEEHRKLQQSYFETMVTYKMECEREIARCRSRGLPEPTFVPHPDDVVIDYRAGTVRIEGPLSPEDKAKWDSFLARRAEAQEEVNYCATEYARTRSPRTMEILLETWVAEQYIFDAINDGMPERYKAKLENRTYVEGASREGHALKQVTRWTRAK
jgi:hypothetical protein